MSRRQFNYPISFRFGNDDGEQSRGVNHDVHNPASLLSKTIVQLFNSMSRKMGEEHELSRQQCRRFVEKELAPQAKEWEDKKDFPNEVFLKVGEMGYHGVL